MAGEIRLTADRLLQEVAAMQATTSWNSLLLDLSKAQIQYHTDLLAVE